MFRCARCNFTNPSNARFCSNCGSGFSATQMQYPSPQTQPVAYPPQTCLPLSKWTGPRVVAVATATLVIWTILQFSGSNTPSSTSSPAATPASASNSNQQKPTNARPDATSEQVAQMAKMSDASLLSQADRSLAGKDVDQIPVSNEDAAATYLREFDRRHPNSKDKHSERTGDRLALVTLARNLASRTAVLDANPPEYIALESCRTAVERNLKAPSTAKFQSHLDDSAQYLGHGKFTIQTKVDSQNSFGAMLRSTFDCEVQCLDAADCSVTAVKEL